MNNDAFKQLVRERSNPKSSKEIAREAVEDEFRQNRKKRKRRGGGGGSSDESESDGDNEKDRRKKNKQRQQKQDSKDADAEIGPDADLYRDRAKERREGNNADYQDSQRLLSGMTAAAKDGQDVDIEHLSKFLGGDEAYTHLVKGLDVTLAKRSVNTDVSAHRQRTQETEQTREPTLAKTAEEAMELIATDIRIVSELGTGILDYLRNTYLPNREVPTPDEVTPEGLAVQRSTLTFSLKADPGEFVRSWEIPREQTYATSDDRAFTKASPLGTSLIDRIEKALAKRTLLAQRSIPLVKAAATHGRVEANVDNGDSDDDIFGNVGDYDPVDANAKEGGIDTDPSPTESKGSIFGTVAPTTILQSDGASSDLDSQDGKGAGSRERDLLPSGRLAGLSSTHDSNKGYGEDMDVDFDGTAEDMAASEGGGEAGKEGKRTETIGREHALLTTTRTVYNHCLGNPKLLRKRNTKSGSKLKQKTKK